MDSYYSDSPWFDYISNITQIIIEDDVSTIGDMAFYNFYNLTAVTIGDRVGSIGFRAFYSCGNLTSVAIPDSVHSIGDQAFTMCGSLTDVTLSSNVTSIGEATFNGCGLTALTIPDSVTTIGDRAFSSCTDLATLTISNGVTTIGNEAFASCFALTSVTIPASVSSIGDGAFASCGLSQIIVDEHNTSFSTDDRSVLFNKNKTTLILAPDTLSGSYEIPDSVTGIHSKAFYSCNSLTAVTIPDSVTTIGEYGFCYCTGLTELVFEGDAPVFGYNAFWNVTATAYYPGTNATWSEDIRQNYGGTVTWTPRAHQWIPATCTTPATCQICGIIEGDALGHSYRSSVTPATPEATGFTTYTCTHCGHSYKNNVTVYTPTISKLESTASGIKLSWKAVAGAEKYRVFAKTSKGWLKLGDTTGTSFLYTGAKTGLTYTFTVRCLNAGGTAYTSAYNTTGWRCKYMPTPTITKFENTASGIKITWGKINGAAKYRVFAKTSKGWLKLADTTATSYTWTGGKTGLTYTFTVRAINAQGTAFTSAYNTTGWRYARIAQPAITKLQNVSNGIKLTWGNVGAAKYRVFAKTSKGWVAVGTVNGTTFTWTGAKKGYTYIFTVRAMNATGTKYISSYNTTGWSVKRT